MQISLRRGCPIRISTDQSLLAAPHGFSQRATSFIASWCQGIHRMPLSRSILTEFDQSNSSPCTEAKHALGAHVFSVACTSLSTHKRLFTYNAAVLAPRTLLRTDIQSDLADRGTSTDVPEPDSHFQRTQPPHQPHLSRVLRRPNGTRKKPASGGRFTAPNSHLHRG